MSIAGHPGLSLEDHAALVGHEVGISQWREITQERIDQFAAVTEDHQFIHVDRERAAAETPYGGSIAHGFLSLSLLSVMAYEAVPPIDGTLMGINYGFEKIRFLSPVSSGSRVRGRFTLRSVAQREEKGIMRRFDVTIEIEGQSKPALVADWLTLALLP